MSHLALAWVVKNDNVSTCIVSSALFSCSSARSSPLTPGQLGATSVTQLEENFKALDILPKLTPDVIEKIEKILDNKPAPPVRLHISPVRSS